MIFLGIILGIISLVVLLFFLEDQHATRLHAQRMELLEKEHNARMREIHRAAEKVDEK